MGLIDELVIAFVSDTTKLKKGLKEGEKEVDKFANAAEKKFKELGDKIQTAFKAYFSFQALKNLTFDFAKETEDLANQAEMVGAKTGDIQMLGNALERFGGNADDAVGAMKSLNNAVVQLRTGGGAFVEIAKQFGIWVKPTKDGNEALLQVGRQLSKLSLKNRIAVAQQLGLSDSLVRAFADGGEELTRLLERQKELGAVTEDDVNASKRFNGAWLDLKDTFGAVRRDIARILLPVATKLINSITDFVDYLRKHKVLVTGFFAALAVAMAPVLKMLTLMAIKTLIMAAPFIKLTAIITAIALIFEDLYYYFKGWDSATGDLVKKFPVLKQTIDLVKPIVLGIVDAFEKIVDWLKDPSWDNFVKILTSIGGTILEQLATPFEAVKNFLNDLMDNIPLLKPLLKPFADLAGYIADTFKLIADIIKSISLDGIKDTFNAITGSIGDAWDGFTGFFGSNKPAKGTKEAEQKAIEKAGLSGLIDKQNINVEKISSGLIDKQNINIGKISVVPPAPYETPLIPAQASVINNNSTANSSNVTNNNNFNNTFNVTNATPKQFVAQAAPAIIRSIDAQTQQAGRL